MDHSPRVLGMFPGSACPAPGVWRFRRPSCAVHCASWYSLTALPTLEQERLCQVCVDRPGPCGQHPASSWELPIEFLPWTLPAQGPQPRGRSLGRQPVGVCAKRPVAALEVCRGMARFWGKQKPGSSRCFLPGGFPSDHDGVQTWAGDNLCLPELIGLMWDHPGLGLNVTSQLNPGWVDWPWTCGPRVNLGPRGGVPVLGAGRPLELCPRRGLPEASQFGTEAKTGSLRRGQRGGGSGGPARKGLSPKASLPKGSGPKYRQVKCLG